MEFREINYVNFVNRRDDLKVLLDNAASDTSKTLLKSCYTQTLYSFFLYTEHVKLLIELMKSVDSKGKRDFESIQKQINDIPKVGTTSIEDLEEEDQKIMEESHTLIEKSKEEFQRVGKNSVVANMLLSVKLVHSIYEYQNESLFNQIYKFDLSEFKEYNIHETLITVLETLTAGLDKAIEGAKLIYDLALNLKTRKTVLDFAEKGDMVNRFLESYNYNISEWIFNTKKLIDLNYRMFLQNSK